MFFLSLLLPVAAVNFDPNSLSNVKNTTDLIVKGLLDYYPLANNDSSKASGWAPGVFQEPYYWWESGVAWGMMVDWQYFTQQTQYNDMIKDAILFQAGSSSDYMPSNQSLTEGNDDQGFWGLAAMTAAERNFTNPDKTQKGWLYGAQAVFNDMMGRWETSKCGGGLRWQIYTWNSGYNYKNTVSNGCLFALGARLARYTGDSMYADWAEKVYNWLVDADLLDSSGNSWAVYDGADMNTNCSNMTKLQWTYNSGLLLSGAAYMYDYTNGSSKWGNIAKGVWSHASSQFFENNIVYESTCQPSGHCNNDQRVFKGIFLQQMGQAAALVPELQDGLMTAINTSANAAAGSCSGGTDGHTCGLDWLSKTYDNQYGLGEQISALAAMINTQTLSNKKPYTAHNGGSSNGSTDAGMANSSSLKNPLADTIPVTTVDRAGAGVVTAILMIFIISVGFWIII